MTQATRAERSARIRGRLDSYPTQQVAGYPVRAGRPLPFGATLVPDGINFAVYANQATSMTLVLFAHGQREPLAELPFPPAFRIGGTYAMTVFGLDPEEIDYGFRADGEFSPEQGKYFDRRAILSDPYAGALGGGEVWGQERDPADPYRYRARVPWDDYDWEGDHPLNLAHEDMVIYELHVRGFTRDESSGVAAPGTYAGLVEKIPYLKALGVTCVELMPVFEFNELENDRSDPASGRRLYNYWGYSPIGFFAPKAGYAATARAGLQVDEFKNLVKQLHRAGIEVILDVVFNHTGEGNELGPTISFRGLDNNTYYIMSGGHYSNYSGTGNTMNCNHPIVRGFILDCLRFWASEYHVDGFRFDLAAILGRAQDGSLLANPPLLESLGADPVLRDCKLIAEAWDAAGLYQIGSFADYSRWSEWNGRYRDVVRRFVKGDLGLAGELATRLTGSADLYGDRGSAASINFVAAHDGFTVADMVSYNDKHNDANGEGNRDGDNGNNSWNCGVEGPTDDPAVLALRRQQSRNLLTLLLVSHGVPMILAGDEVGRTQGGNNNAYCQDGPLSWFDWNLVEKNADLLQFVQRMLQFRAQHRALRPGRAAIGPEEQQLFPTVSWHGVRAWSADWAVHCRLVAVMFYDRHEGSDDCVYVATNSYWEGLDLELPELPEHLAWHRFIDTTASSPDDAAPPGAEPRLDDQSQVRVGARGTLVLLARPS
jgi:isoamylase